MTITLERPAGLTPTHRPSPAGPAAPAAAAGPTAILSRRSLRSVLGLLWVLDGALQLQSFMFTKGFAHQIVAPAAAGQPSFVSAPVRWNAELIAHQPVLLNALFAATQLAIGVGLLVPRTWRPALVASVLWAGVVWYLGEGLGGLAGGHVTALAGAPGAAVLYLVLAVAAWPAPEPYSPAPAGRRPERPPHWLVPVWAALWAGAAVLELLPGNRSASTLTAQLTANADSVPAWLGGFDRWLGRGAHGLGGGATALLVGLELAIALASTGRGAARTLALWSGIGLAGVFWAAGQSFGQLLSGQATDPNTGPLLILLGLAALSARRGAARPGIRRRAPARPPTGPPPPRSPHRGPEPLPRGRHPGLRSAGPQPLRLPTRPRR